MLLTPGKQDFPLGNEVLRQSKGGKGENAGRVIAERKYSATCGHSRQALTSAREPKTGLEEKGAHADRQKPSMCDSTVSSYFSLGLHKGEKNNWGVHQMYLTAPRQALGHEHN